jgi:hypothetical protein
MERGACGTRMAARCEHLWTRKSWRPQRPCEKNLREQGSTRGKVERAWAGGLSEIAIAVTKGQFAELGAEARAEPPARGQRARTSWGRACTKTD